MKEVNMYYSGYIKEQYCFEDENGKRYCFKKANNSLVYEYDLRNNTYVGTLFKVRYFVVSVGDKDELILSDLTFPKRDLVMKQAR
ncbi:MAG: hypothetical protein HUJ25_04715 [Crocinitomicaceae bacterium]|nr:hypothetical protein [Crocinitomicaceae bacterium]